VTKPLRTQDYTLIGPYLRQIREARGIAQGEIAERIGHTQSFVANVELGVSQPSLKALFVWMQELDLAVEVYDLTAPSDDL